MTPQKKTRCSNFAGFFRFKIRSLSNGGWTCLLRFNDACFRKSCCQVEENYTVSRYLGSKNEVKVGKTGKKNMKFPSQYNLCERGLGTNENILNVVT